MPLVTLLGLYNDGEILKHNTTGLKLSKVLRSRVHSPEQGRGAELLTSSTYLPYCQSVQCSMLDRYNTS